MSVDKNKAILERNLNVFNDILAGISYADTAKKYDISRVWVYKIVKELAESKEIPHEFPLNRKKTKLAEPPPDYESWLDAYKESLKLRSNGHHAVISYNKPNDTWSIRVL